jgi:tetratricopeptide (TPR) repeat protein
MITLPLELRPAKTAAVTHAFLIPGHSPQTWIDILIRAAQDQWPIEKARLFILPASRRDLTPAGLFVVPAACPHPKPPVRTLAYTSAANCLFHPVESALYPPLTPGELQSILPFDVAVFHPAIGIVGFRREEALHFAQLLQLPQKRDRQWNYAIPGPPPPQPLHSVEVEMPDIEQLLDLGRDDIGTESPEDLPRLPNEPVLKPLIVRMLSLPHLLGGQLAQTLGLKKFSQEGEGPWMATAPGGRPATGSSAIPGWFLKMLANFTGASKGASPAKPASGNFMSNAPDEKRQRELDRLLNMLKQSPDEGLRHAIPFGNLGGSRGLTTPGATLRPHDVNFSMRGFQGGRPVDYWNIPPNFQAQLQARYRELANRELNLGRFRRAAYIFAELLGDLSGAASALKQGRLYREAAALYKDKLNQPRQAAQCLEDGGLLTEAIDLYKELQDFEKAGDLYVRLERPADAATAYRTEVARRLPADRLSAARLLESKLQVPDEALEVLDAGWPSSIGAPCLLEAFALRARLARHEDAAAKITALRKSRTAEDLAVELAEVLSKVSQTYADPAVQATAADATRVIVGNALATASPTAKTVLVKFVTAVDPADLLLGRDGRRFLARKPATTPRTPKNRTPAPILLNTFALDDKIQWSAALAVGDRFFVCGHQGIGVHLAEVNEGGGFSPTEILNFFSTPPRHPQFLMAPIRGSNGQFQIVLHEVTTNSYPKASPMKLPLPEIVAAPSAGKTEPPLGLAYPLMGLCSDDAGIHWAINGGPSLALSSWDMAAGGVMRASYDLRPWLGELNTDTLKLQRMPLLVRRDHIFFAAANRLVHVAYLRTARHFNFDGDVLRIVASDALSRLRVAVVAPESSLVIFADGRESRFAEGMNAPVIAFTRGGTLIARDDNELRVYFTEGDRLSHASSFRVDSPRPIAMLPTPQLDEFATISASGLVQIFRLPRA